MSDTDECPQSQRVDGPWHSWAFDGDDPYVVCSFCGERRDARTGRVIRPKDPTATPRPELREQAIAHIAWLRRSSGAPSGWTADNRQSADLLERLVNVVQPFAGKVEDLRAEVDALRRIVRHHQAGHEAVDGLWVVDDGTSVTPQVVGEVSPAEVDALRALVAPDPTSPTDTGDTP